MPKIVQGEADYLLLGSWNATCYRCGRKFKSSEMKKTWQGFFVCRADWEPRQPQDFVKSPVASMPPPWTQPDPGPAFVTVYSGGGSSIPSYAIPSFFLPSQVPTI